MHVRTYIYVSISSCATYVAADDTNHEQFEQTAKLMSDAAESLNQMGMGSLVSPSLNAFRESGLFEGLSTR